MNDLPWLTILIAVPLIAGALCLFVRAEASRWIALIATLAALNILPHGTACSAVEMHATMSPSVMHALASLKPTRSRMRLTISSPICLTKPSASSTSFIATGFL